MQTRAAAGSAPIGGQAAPGLAGQPGLLDIVRARQLIRHRVRRTPLVASPSLSRLAGVPVHLKLECQQTTGSFKLRGASHALAKLPAPALQQGVVTASTGNHGRAVAHAAKAGGVRAVVCMSHLVPHNKVEAIRALGAEVRIVGQSQDDAQAEALRLSTEQGLAMIPPFDHPDVIAGQGTIGLEIVEQLPEVGSVLIPLSGGGLFAGVALALKALNPAIRTTGITMEAGCAMHASLRAGRPVQVEEVPTLADSLGGGIGLDNRHSFPLVQALADETVLVDEPSIRQGIRHAYLEEREVVEGAAAVGIAALLSGLVHAPRSPGPIVVLLSGRNIDMTLHRRLIGAA
jgi:threonine dehydratase